LGDWQRREFDWRTKRKTPSISCWKIEGVLNSKSVSRGSLNYPGFDVTCSFPELLRGCFRCSRQGFLTSGSSALLHGLPSLAEETSDLPLEATQLPVHSGGNRLGISPNFPCRPYGHLRRSNSMSDDSELDSELLLQRTMLSGSAKTLCSGLHYCQAETPKRSLIQLTNAEGVREFQPSGWSEATTLGKMFTRIR